MDLQFLRAGLTVEPSVGATMKARARTEEEGVADRKRKAWRGKTTQQFGVGSKSCCQKQNKFRSDGKYLLFSVSGADLRKQRSCN